MTESKPETTPRGPLAWMANNIVAANLLMIVLLVGGFIVAKLGHIPVVGTVATSDGIQVKVLVSDARRVERLEMKVLPEEILDENER